MSKILITWHLSKPSGFGRCLLLLLIFSLLFMSCQKQKEVTGAGEQSDVLKELSKWYYFEKNDNEWIRRSRVILYTEGLMVMYTPIGDATRNKWEQNGNSVNMTMDNGIVLAGKKTNDNLISGTGKNKKSVTWEFEMRKVDEFEHNDGTIPHIYSETELQGIKLLQKFISDLTFKFGVEKVSDGENKDLELFVKNNGKPDRIEITDVEYLDQNRPQKYKNYRLYYEDFFYEFEYNRNYIEYKKGGRKFDSLANLNKVQTTDNASFDNGVYIGMPEAEFWQIFGLDKDMPKTSSPFFHSDDPEMRMRNYGIASDNRGVWIYFSGGKLAYMRWNEEYETFSRDPSLPKPKPLFRYVPLPSDGSWPGDIFITDESTPFDEITLYRGGEIPNNEIVFDKTLPESETAVIHWVYHGTGTVRPIAYNGNKVDWKISRNRVNTIRIPAGKTVFEFKGQTSTEEPPPLGLVWDWDGFSFTYNFEKGKKYGINIEGTTLIIYKDAIFRDDFSLARFKKPDNEPYPLMWLMPSEKK